MEITFNSRKLGNEVTFWSNIDMSSATTAYVWVDTNGKSGTLGVQCFDAKGSAEVVTEESFDRDCKRIYRKMIANR